MIQRRILSTAAGAAVLVLALAGCAGGGETTETPEPGGDAGQAVDAEPVTLTMWTRSVTAAQSEALVAAFNDEYDGRITIELTVVPHTEYLQKVSAAASGDNLPDILAANVIDGPNYATLGLWADITDRVQALDFADTLAPAHMAVGTLDDRIYAVPHVVDVSALYYNTVLFERAGLDPADPPSTLKEVAEDAAAIDALGDDIGGLYLPGDCGGCLAFTVFPSIWAAGGTVMNEEGTEGTFDAADAADVLSVYHQMWNDGSMVAESRNETGATQNAAFEAGTVGFALLGSKALGTIAENENLKIGVAPIPGPDGGTSTFVGGDIIGISSSSNQADAAWTFLEWSLGEQVQLDIYAQAGFIPVRTDLADNEYAAADERVVLMNGLVAEGQLPYSPRFFQTFNDPQGPFLAMIREAVFGSGPDSLTTGNAAVTESLQSGM
jgi:multiple sugar transport system substrate-binding protein